MKHFIKSASEGVPAAVAVQITPQVSRVKFSNSISLYGIPITFLCEV